MKSNVANKLDLFFLQFKPVHYKKREIVCYAEDTPSSVFYIKNGFVRAYRLSERGEELTVIILKPGDFFPLWLATSNTPNPYYFETITSLDVFRVTKEQFIRFLTTHPDVFYELNNMVQIRFGGLLTRMEYLIFSNAYTKVAATLLVCAKRFGIPEGDFLVVSLPLTHKDIATLAGITRETTCLEMKKLERKGLIAHRGRFLVVRDIKKLGAESLLRNETDQLLYNSL